jgi:hypothetical protein
MSKIGSKRQVWESCMIQNAVDMAKELHIGKQEALGWVACWMMRAAYRYRDGVDIYTGEPKKKGEYSGSG